TCSEKHAGCRRCRTGRRPKGGQGHRNGGGAKRTAIWRGTVPARMPGKRHSLSATRIKRPADRRKQAKQRRPVARPAGISTGAVKVYAAGRRGFAKPGEPPI